MRRIPFQGLMAWILSLGVGIAVWFVVSAYAGRTEAWDAMTPYVVASSIAAFLLGVLVPRHPWRSAFLLVAGQAIAAFVTQKEDDGLLLAGLAMFLVLGSIFGIAAYAGARLRQSVASHSPARR